MSSFAGYVAGPTGKLGAKIAGSSRKPYRYISLSFIVETGPEAFNRICEDAVSDGNIAQHRFVDCSRELGSRSVPKQRNCYLPFISVLRDLSRPLPGLHLRKKQRLRSDLKSVQSARRRHCPSSLVKRNRGTDFSLSALWARQSRFCSSHPGVFGADVLPLWMGVGLLEAATVFRETTAGVACLPKLCAALRLKTFEARPDARCGPVRGKAGIEDSSSLRSAVISGPWEPGAGGFVPFGVRFRRPGNGNASVAVTSTTSNDSVRDSLPEKMENSLLISSQNHQSLNTVWK